MKVAGCCSLVLTLVASVGFAADLESWRRTEYNRTRTFQNLASLPDSASTTGGRALGLFLAVDATGVPKMTSQSILPYPGAEAEAKYRDADPFKRPLPEVGVPNLQSWWQVKMVTKKRDHLAHVIMNRGNTKYNGQYLALDPKNGEVIMSKRESANSYWLVRYAGKYRGWDSFLVQNNSETDGVTDMKFLAVDEQTGKLIITADPKRSMNWLIQFAPDLPTETKHY